MLQNERQEEIMRRIKETKTVRIGELAGQLEVTRETIRRDLYELEKQGLLRRVHGGAVLNKAGEEPPYAERSISRVQSKEAIARKAAAYVEDGDTLFIDLGTTTLLFSKQLRGKKQLTVVTNSLPVAIELCGNDTTRVILLGGELRKGDLSLSGSVTEKTMADFYVDKSFIGAGGISPEHGITDYHVGEASIRRAMMKRSKMNVVLADQSKFNVTAFTKVCELDEADVIIVEGPADEHERNRYADLGVELIYADEALEH